MKTLRYYVKLTFLMLLMSMAAFGMVMPGMLNTRKKYADKAVTVEWVTNVQKDVITITEDKKGG